MGTNRSIGSFFSGVVIGGLAGAATALLLAPQSGEETRTQIREKGIELREQVETTYADLQEKVETVIGSLQDKADRLSAQVDQAVAQVGEAFSQETIDLAQEAAPSEEPVAEEVVLEPERN